MDTINSATSVRVPWNKGKLVGQKAPFKLKEIWAIRVGLQIASRCRELALFNLAVDSELRACDLVKLRVRDVCHGQNMASRALILLQKTQRPVQFEITEPTRGAVSAWIKKSALNSEDFLFLSRIQESPHLSTRQCARIVDSWVHLLGLDTTSYGTHTPRRTKATLIYRRTKNLRAVQLLLGHSKLESTVRYLVGSIPIARSTFRCLACPCIVSSADIAFVACDKGRRSVFQARDFARSQLANGRP
jgi:site-specific recombinase XerC